jgi:hypothetical protein
MALSITSGTTRACDAAHVHASAHRTELAASKACGCFYCFGIFRFAEIVKWTDENQTALCPRCGIDAVLGDASGFPIDATFLRNMHRYWFTMHSKH